MNYEELLADTEKKLDDAFTEMGEIREPTLVDIYLLASAVKAIKFSESIMLLCSNRFVKQSLPLLRSFIEHAVNMRWIMHRDTEKRIREYLANLAKPTFGGFWTKISLENRMREIGFREQDYYDLLIKYISEYPHFETESISWNTVKNDERFLLSKIPIEAVRRITVQMLSHVAAALSVWYGTRFSFYKEINRKLSEELEKRTQYQTPIYKTPPAGSKPGN